jgi:hypothetical protein
MALGEPSRTTVPAEVEGTGIVRLVRGVAHVTRTRDGPAREQMQRGKGNNFPGRADGTLPDGGAPTTAGRRMGVATSASAGCAGW